MTWPELSVVMPNYNHAHFISEALEPILAQSFRPSEVIVIDDGSTDNSLDVIEAIARRDPTVRVLQNERNIGAVASGNRGLASARGDYVYFAAADDRILPGFFEKSMRLLARHPEAALCSTLSGWMDGAGTFGGIVHTPVVARRECFMAPRAAMAMLRRHGNWFMGNTVIYRRAGVVELGGLDPELGHYCDGFMDLVLALKYGVCFIPEPLAIWRRAPNTYSVTTSANPEALLQIMQTAEGLMRTRYRDVFPSEFVEEWKGRCRYDMAVGFVGAIGGLHVAGVEQLLQLPRRGDRAFLAGLRLAGATQQLATKLYFLLRLRRADLWREVMRKVRHWFY